MIKPSEPTQGAIVPRDAVPGWIQSLRDAAAKHLRPDVLENIVKAQIAAAERGDPRAIKFVFDYLLGAAALKGGTFIQNNYAAGAARPDEPTSARPGSPDKISIMQQRVAAGLKPCRPGDAPTSGDLR